MNRKRAVLSKNEHEYAAKRLSAYLDRQVSDREYVRIKAHLETCEQCQQDLETLLWTKRLLRQVPVVPVPRSFVVREADVVASKFRPRRTMFAMQWATAIVALLFVVVLFGDALTGGWMSAGSRQAVPEAMMAEPVAMEQSEQEKVEEPKAFAIESEIVQEKEIAPEKEGAPKEVQIEVEEETVRGTDQAWADATPSDAEKLRAVVPDAAPGDVDGVNVVTATSTSAPVAMPVEKIAPPAEPTPSPETQLAAVPPTPAQDELQVATVQEDAQPVEQPSPAPSGPAPMRVIWRGVEIGLGVALIGLIVTIILLRRRA
jgi:hypothetical protein